MSKQFKLTKRHIKLLRHMHTDWNYAESGAPMINPKRPYGEGDLLDDMIAVLNEGNKLDLHRSEMLNDKEYKQYEELHREMDKVLQIVLKTGKFKPGIYICGDDGNNWRCKK